MMKNYDGNMYSEIDFKVEYASAHIALDMVGPESHDRVEWWRHILTNMFTFNPDDSSWVTVAWETRAEFGMRASSSIWLFLHRQISCYKSLKPGLCKIDLHN